MSNHRRVRRPIAWLRGLVPAGLLATLITLGACDFQVLEPWDPPRWGVSLTLPLVNMTYALDELVNDSTIFQDTTTHELQIEFQGELDATSIDPGFLEVTLPPEATPDPVYEEINAPDAADYFSATAESIIVTIALDSLLRNTGQPAFQNLSFPDTIPLVVLPAIWNSFFADSALEQQEGPYELIDTTALVQDNSFIKRLRYIQLSGTGGLSEFATTVVNSEFPTSVDSIYFTLASSPLSVRHENASLDTNATFSQTTDLASEKLGSELTMGFGMMLPTVADTVTIPAGDDPKIEITVRLSIGGVDSLGITTNQVSLLQAPIDPLPLPDSILITSGQLRTGETDPINTIELSNLSNTLPFDIRFKLTFPNFTTSLVTPDSLALGAYTLSYGDPVVNDSRDLSGTYFHNPAGGGSIEAFEVDVVAEVLERDIVLPLDGSSLGVFQATFSVGDLYFLSITGDFEMGFDTVPTTIDKIPKGFEGFQFDRLSLKLFLRNEIGLPVVLDLGLTGINDRLGSATVDIDAPINYPSAPGAPANNGDTASTIIILDQNSVRTYWVPEGATDISLAWDSTITTSGGTTIVDVLNLAPDTIKVEGGAFVRGEGKVVAAASVWGEFELIAPFAFILPQDISFLPVDPIPLDPMAEDTRLQIREALISASLITEVENNFPLGGQISMLASDTTLFTLLLDRLDDIAFGIPETLTVEGETVIYDNVDSVLALDGITGISHIVFHADASTSGKLSDPRQTRAQRVDFYTSPSDTTPAFWIGRLFDMAIPSPRSVSSLGYIITPGDTTQVIALDAERIGWLASETTTYLKPFITFYATGGARTMQSTNSIGMAIFIAFNLTSDVFQQEEEQVPSDIVVTRVPNATIDLGDTVQVDLDTVFTHPSKKAKDMELTTTTSHEGIATTLIWTDRSGSLRKKMLRVIGAGPGTAQITVTADDDPEDDVDPVKTSFQVTVQGSGGGLPRKPEMPAVAGRNPKWGPSKEK